MESLRRVYEEQTEKAKNEYMLVHSDKVFENNLSDNIARKQKCYFFSMMGFAS